MSVNIQLLVTDLITDDVKRGIQLYGLATGELVPENAADRIEQWLSLFRGNPLGGGLFAVAKHLDEVVGFFSIIDMEMLVRGRPIKTGKTEFFVVQEEMRWQIAPGTKVPLPWALFRLLRTQAKKYGYQVILMVPSPAATLFPRVSGDLCLRTSLVTYKVPGPANCESGRLRRYAAKFFRSRQLSVVRSRIDRLVVTSGVNDGIKIEQAVTNGQYTGDNALVSPGSGMIGLRFPSNSYLNYTLHVPGQSPLFFAFDQPTYRGSVRLVHWSGLPEAFEAFAAVLARVLDRAHLVKCLELVIELPAEQVPANYRLEDYGFVNCGRREDVDCYLLDVNEQLDLSAVKNWHVTHGHKGFYS